MVGIHYVKGFGPCILVPDFLFPKSINQVPAKRERGCCCHSFGVAILCQAGGSSSCPENKQAASYKMKSTLARSVSMSGKMDPCLDLIPIAGYA